MKSLMGPLKLLRSRKLGSSDLLGELSMGLC
jgi:hypothetical protein